MRKKFRAARKQLKQINLLPQERIPRKIPWQPPIQYLRLKVIGGDVEAAEGARLIRFTINPGLVPSDGVQADRCQSEA